MSKRHLWLVLLLGCRIGSPLGAQSLPDGTDAQFEARRAQVLDRLRDGITLVQARRDLMHFEEHVFKQAPNFYYLTGLSSAVGAVLALDGPTRSTWLFVPPAQWGMSMPWVAPGAETAARLRIDHVVPWNEFPAFLERRLAADPGSLIYLEQALPEDTLPAGVPPLYDRSLLWQKTLQSRWPDVTIRSAGRVLAELRAVKSEHELRAIRRAARASADALLATLPAVRAGRTQREIEARVVTECVRSGGEGPSFWPWVMSGPNAPVEAALEGTADYYNRDRVLREGELVRLDLGCRAAHYMGDVGRTVPAGGHFDAGQRETWDLLIRAYQAGLKTIKAGVRGPDVIAASIREVERLQDGLRTPLARDAARELIASKGAGWQLHGVGLEAAEGGAVPEVLLAGMVVAFEPMFTVDGQAFYLEDMIVVTSTGHELLTTGLPYHADEVERAMRR